MKTLDVHNDYKLQQMEVLVKDMHYIQYDCKKVCLLYQS